MIELTLLPIRAGDRPQMIGKSRCLDVEELEKDAESYQARAGLRSRRASLCFAKGFG
jgi:hypothetical protein